MLSLLWSLLSTIILVPIIYFLPIGLTLKGKFIVISTALIISLLGQTASSAFDLTKALSVIVLIIALSTYILDKRLGILLYGKPSTINGEENSNTFLKKHMDISSLEHKATTKDTHKQIDGKELNEIQGLISVVNEELSEANVTSALNFEKDDSGNSDEHLNIYEEDISFLFNRNLELKHEEKSTKSEENELKDRAYISAIADVAVTVMEKKNANIEEIDWDLLETVEAPEKNIEKVGGR
jgi:hypothetical protein